MGTRHVVSLKRIHLGSTVWVLVFLTCRVPLASGPDPYSQRRTWICLWFMGTVAKRAHELLWRCKIQERRYGIGSRDVLSIDYGLWKALTKLRGLRTLDRRCSRARSSSKD